MELVIPSCIRGYHVYGEVWTAVLDKQLLCEREVGNVVDQYTIAMKNDASITVGHLQQNIMCYKNNTDFNVAKLNQTRY